MKTTYHLYANSQIKTENSNQGICPKMDFNQNQCGNSVNCNKETQSNDNYSLNKEKEILKEERRFKQEEYRRILDNQRREELERKEKEKQGLIPLVPLMPESLNDNSLLGKDNYRSSQQSNADLSEKELLKERERQKKVEYFKYLQIQIEESKQRKEIKKQKQLEEDKKRENRYKLLNQNIPKLIQLKGKNHYNNQILTTDEQMILQQQAQFNPYHNENVNSNNTNCGNFPSLKLNSLEKSCNQLPNHLSTNANNNNNYNTVIPPIISQGPYCDLSCRNTHFPSQEQLYPQYNTINTNQFPDIQQRNYICNTPSSTVINQTAQQSMLSLGNINEIFQTFVNNQMKRISDYEMKVETIQIIYPQKNNYELVQLLISERNKTMDLIKSDQENMRTLFGFYPMQNEFNQKISNLLNLILDRKVGKIQKEEKKTMGLLEEEKSHKIDNNPKADIIVLKVAKNEQIKDGISIITSQLNRDIQRCNYYSKYEDLKQSIINLDDATPELKESLTGISKLVTPTCNTQSNNNINSQHLYQTWKGEWRYESADKNTSKLESINEEERNPNPKLNISTYSKSQSMLLMSDSLNKSNEDKMSNRVVHSHSHLSIMGDCLAENDQLREKDNRINLNNNRDQINDLFDHYNRNIINNNSYLSVNPINDSYSDNIINNLQKYRRMALDNSSVTDKHSHEVNNNK